MNTLFTDVHAAVEEGHFIQKDLRKTCFIVVDDDNNLHVITADQYARRKWETTRVIEKFNR